MITNHTNVNTHPPKSSTENLIVHGDCFRFSLVNQNNQTVFFAVYSILGSASTFIFPVLLKPLWNLRLDKEGIPSPDQKGDSKVVQLDLLFL